MFYYSKKNHRKIVHTEKCYILSKLDPEAVGTFDTLPEAYKAGYRLCRRCSLLEKLYRSEEDALLDYARRNGMALFYSGKSLKIVSTISKWMLTLSNDGGLALYHQNTIESRTDEQSDIPGYHYQKARYKTIIEYLDYIKEHDYFRNRNPLYEPPKKKAPPKKGTKRWRKQEKRIAKQTRKRSINNVLNLIDSLDNNYNCDFKIY